MRRAEGAQTLQKGRILGSAEPFPGGGGRGGSRGGYVLGSGRGVLSSEGLVIRWVSRPVSRPIAAPKRGMGVEVGLEVGFEDGGGRDGGRLGVHGNRRFSWIDARSAALVQRPAIFCRRLTRRSALFSKERRAARRL